MLGVFLLPAFTRLGHDVRTFEVCAMESMCAQTRPWFILSSKRVFLGNGVRTYVHFKGKIPSTGGGWTLRCCVTQDSKPITLPTELFLSPQNWFESCCSALTYKLSNLYTYTLLTCTLTCYRYVCSCLDNSVCQKVCAYIVYVIELYEVDEFLILIVKTEHVTVLEVLILGS